jgi:PDGLE domain-containing protein
MTIVRRRISFGLFITAVLAVAVTLALVVSPWASDEPDGLGRVAIDEGFAAQQSAHPLEGSPTTGYEVAGVDDDRLSTGLAGVIGVAITFTLAAGLTLGLRRRNRRTSTA